MLLGFIGKSCQTNDSDKGYDHQWDYRFLGFGRLTW